MTAGGWHGGLRFELVVVEVSHLGEDPARAVLPAPPCIPVREGEGSLALWSANGVGRPSAPGPLHYRFRRDVR